MTATFFYLDEVVSVFTDKNYHEQERYEDWFRWFVQYRLAPELLHDRIEFEASVISDDL